MRISGSRGRGNFVLGLFYSNWNVEPDQWSYQIWWRAVLSSDLCSTLCWPFEDAVPVDFRELLIWIWGLGTWHHLSNHPHRTLTGEGGIDIVQWRGVEQVMRYWKIYPWNATIDSFGKEDCMDNILLSSITVLTLSSTTYFGKRTTNLLNTIFLWLVWSRII